MRTRSTEPARTPHATTSFAVKMGLAGTVLPLAMLLLAGLAAPMDLPDLLLFLIPLAEPLALLCPDTIYDLAYYGFWPWPYLAGSVLVAAAWFAVGYLAGRVMARSRARSLKASILLIVFTIAIPASALVASTQRSWVDVDLIHYRYAGLTMPISVDVTCVEAGAYSIRSESQGTERAFYFRGTPASVRRCGEVFVVTENRYLPEPAEVYFSYPGGDFLGSCPRHGSPEPCRTLEFCSPNLCPRTR